MLDDGSNIDDLIKFKQDGVGVKNVENVVSKKLKMVSETNENYDSV